MNRHRPKIYNTVGVYVLRAVDKPDVLFTIKHVGVSHMACLAPLHITEAHVTSMSKGARTFFARVPGDALDIPRKGGASRVTW
jgi:hypothetical protein